MPIIWTDQYLITLLNEADKRIASDFDLHFSKYALTIVQGTSTYALHPLIKKVMYITWEGKKLEPLAFNEVNDFAFQTAVVSDAVKDEYSEGVPRFYTVHPNNMSVIRLVPTPNKSITPSGLEDLWAAPDIRTQCVVTCYRYADPASMEFKLPDHLGRRYKKHYALYRAFLKEGKGQNLNASDYHRKMMIGQTEVLKLVNANTYVSKRSCLEPTDDRAVNYGYGIGVPQLPSNYPGRKI